MISDPLGTTQPAIIGGDAGTHFGPITPTGSLTAIKTGSLLTDTDQNSVVSPGDALRYAVHISNTSQQVITSVTFTDHPDPNTSLIVGSVQTTLGTVTSGNNPGNTSVGVDIGTIAVGQSVDIHYDVIITNPMPAGVVTVTNQRVVSSTQGTTPTDDPINPGPTVITVTVPTTPTGALNLTVANDVVQVCCPARRITSPGQSLTSAMCSSPAVCSPPSSPAAAAPHSPPSSRHPHRHNCYYHPDCTGHSQPVAYGAGTVTVTGSILTTTAVLATHICAPDFRTSDANVHSHFVFAHEELTYTWHISNTGDAAAPGTTAVLTLRSLRSSRSTTSWNVDHWHGDLQPGDERGDVDGRRADQRHGLVDRVLGTFGVRAATWAAGGAVRGGSPVSAAVCGRRDVHLPLQALLHAGTERHLNHKMT